MRKFFVALGLAMMVLVPGASSAQSERYWERTTIPIDWYLTATDYPCLVETVRVTGTYQETFHAVFAPSGSYSAVLTQTKLNFVAVGVTSGGTMTTNITVDAAVPHLASVTFSTNLTKVYLHWRRS